MTTVCLVRHGETNWNQLRKLQGREDIELNQNGILQASNCAEYLKTEHWDAIVTSPLKRAKATADIIRMHTGVERVDVVADFIERDYGKASGLTLDQRSQLFPDGIIDGQEDWNLLKARAMKALEDILVRYGGMRVIVVSHGGLINSVLSEISHGEIGTGKTVLANGCISLIKHDGSHWSIESYNQTPC